MPTYLYRLLACGWAFSDYFGLLNIRHKDESSTFVETIGCDTHKHSKFSLFQIQS